MFIGIATCVLGVLHLSPFGGCYVVVDLVLPGLLGGSRHFLHPRVSRLPVTVGQMSESTFIYLPIFWFIAVLCSLFSYCAVPTLMEHESPTA